MLLHVTSIQSGLQARLMVKLGNKWNYLKLPEILLSGHFIPQVSPNSITHHRHSKGEQQELHPKDSDRNSEKFYPFVLPQSPSPTILNGRNAQWPSCAVHNIATRENFDYVEIYPNCTDFLEENTVIKGIVSRLQFFYELLYYELHSLFIATC